MVRSSSGFAVCTVAMALLCAPKAGAWEPVRLRASGVGYAPSHLAGTARGRLMAERAAQVIAARNLAVQSYGIPQGAHFTAYLPNVRTVRVRSLPGYGVKTTVETTMPVWHVRERVIEW